MKSQVRIRTYAFFHRAGNTDALRWKTKIRRELKRRFPAISESDTHPDVLIVLGGDGAILEASRLYQRRHPIILGLNLGHVGFLASVRNPKKFISAIDRFFSGQYTVEKRIMLEANVFRGSQRIFSTHALNEVVVHNPLGMVELDVSIDGHPMQYIRGSGILIATATGSTAYNLSAHGPIVMPQIPCMIVTELLDHNIPTPSIVLQSNQHITLTIKKFRERKLLSISSDKTNADVLIVADGETLFPLQRGDTIRLKRSKQIARFASIDPHHFLKSVQEKFSFK